MKLRTLLALGRVSNLPTVWTNVLSGAVLSGAVSPVAALSTAAITLSSFYIGGMFLNDAFDRAFDAAHQPHRPIPSGQASARSVFAIGFGLLAVGLCGVTWIAWTQPNTVSAVVAAIALALTITFYNVHHKGNPWSPLVMGLCRVLVYITTGLMLGGALTVSLFLGSGALLAYLIALTFIAKRGGGARVVGLLLAGICLVDAIVLLLCAQPLLAAVAILGFPLTLALHRRVAGT